MNVASQSVTMDDLVHRYADNTTISEAALRTLRPKAWLNDRVIDTYFNLLALRDARQDTVRRCLFVDTLYWKRWDLYAIHERFPPPDQWRHSRQMVDSKANLDKVLIPINIQGEHWTLAVIDYEKEQLEYYCSFHDSYDEGLFWLRRLADDVLAQIDPPEGSPWGTPIEDWPQVVHKHIPKQTNGYDCGVFVCMMANCLSVNASLLDARTTQSRCREHIIASLYAHHIEDP